MLPIDWGMWRFAAVRIALVIVAASLFLIDGSRVLDISLSALRE